jgi:hypothetical protein
MDKIKQISIIDSGLVIEYVENKQYNFFHINREQTQEIFNMNIDFGKHKPIFSPTELGPEVIQDIQDIILQGYPIREYKNQDNFYHKCGEVTIDFSHDLSRGYAKDFLFKAKIFGVSCAIFKGDIYEDYVDEILLFAQENKIFSYVLYENQCGFDKIDIWSNIDFVIIDANSISTSVLSKVILYFYEKKIGYGIINFDGDFDFIHQYDGIIYEVTDVNKLLSGYGMVLKSGQIEFYNPNVQIQKEYSGDLNIAKKWINFIKLNN